MQSEASAVEAIEVHRSAARLDEAGPFESAAERAQRHRRAALVGLRSWMSEGSMAGVLEPCCREGRSGKVVEEARVAAVLT